MRPPEHAKLYQACLVRFVEEELLNLFAAGKLSGTTHTCIGQEMSATSLVEALDPQRDVIVSNHRCHGHYLAWTDDVDGLLAEVMGKETGVCGGIGGSQHLCGKGFFSNGIQGGAVPVAAGLAFAQKLAGHGGVVVACIGDGTLGEGTIYETFNIAVKWGLPLLILLENNLYAQSTSQSETLAGDICARAAAFGMPTFRGDTWDDRALGAELQKAVRMIRSENAPAFIQVDTYRLMAHSKGDDNRDPAEIAAYAKRDPVNLFLARKEASADQRISAVRERVKRAMERAESAPVPTLKEPPAPTGSATRSGPLGLGSGSQLEAINRALSDWMAADESVILLGEDIRSPYGGAFKATRGISDQFPTRVLNTPISEAAIVGIGSGLALGGQRPVVEIMFGDFLTLCFDQLVNHASKFNGMYNGKVTCPVVVRTPMGGGRGYGPTHSQNLEKHFAGIPGLNVLVMHGRTRVPEMYAEIRKTMDPVLIIENKLLYRERCDASLPSGYSMHEVGEHFPATVLTPEDEPDLTIVAFGRMSALAEKAAARLADEEEIFAELVFPLGVSPLDPEAMRQSAARTGKLLVLEEGTSGFDLASEVIASVALAKTKAGVQFARLAAKPMPIPSAPAIEQHVLPGVGDVVKACLDLFDV